MTVYKPDNPDDGFNMLIIEDEAIGFTEEQYEYLKKRVDENKNTKLVKVWSFPPSSSNFWIRKQFTDKE